MAVALFAWQGMLLSIPHDHADVGVSQEEFGCLASRPLSDANHLHSAGTVLTPHVCIACIAGQSDAAVSAAPTSAGIVPAAAENDPISVDCRPQSHSHLPLLRGPPHSV